MSLTLCLLCPEVVPCTKKQTQLLQIVSEIVTKVAELKTFHLNPRNNYDNAALLSTKKKKSLNLMILTNDSQSRGENVTSSCKPLDAEWIENV